MTASQRDLFLITGIPGTGKTCYGDKFASEFGFVHYDLEDEQTCHRFFDDPAQFIADAIGQTKNVVVTWGFVPDNLPSVLAVLQFRNAGFKLIWFDGDRDAALRTFQNRARAKEKSDAAFYWRMYEFYLQMHRIENTKIVDQLKPTIINPFDIRGEFKPTAALLKEMRKA